MMADETNNQQKSDSMAPVAKPSFLSASPQKSPLEESVGDQTSSINTAQIDAIDNSNKEPTPLNKPITALPPEEENDEMMSSTDGSVPVAEEPTPAPDTDEFLKSILSDSPPPAAPAPETQTSPTPPPLPPVEPLPQETEISAPTPEPVAEPISPLPVTEISSPPSSPDFLEAPESKIVDSTSSLDSIVGQNKPPQPDGIGQPVTPDVVSAMQQKTPAKTGKVILLFVIAVIIVVAGYIGYLALFGGKNSNSPTAASATVTAISLTNDQLRKQDLKVIQNNLINYKAGSGRFPISATRTSLSTADNVLTKELVPTYLDKIPVDPDPNKNYYYQSDGLTFTLTATLDDATDPQAVNESGAFVYKLTDNISATTATPTATATAGIF